MKYMFIITERRDSHPLTTKILSDASKLAAATKSRVTGTAVLHRPLLIASPLPQRIIHSMASAGGAFGGSRGLQPLPPEKGVFPLDHFGECKQVRWGGYYISFFGMVSEAVRLQFLCTENSVCHRIASLNKIMLFRYCDMSFRLADPQRAFAVNLWASGHSQTCPRNMRPVWYAHV